MANPDEIRMTLLGDVQVRRFDHHTEVVVSVQHDSKHWRVATYVTQELLDDVLVVEQVLDYMLDKAKAQILNQCKGLK